MFSDLTPIDVYTREDAISDGSLVDVTKTAAEAGIVGPVAMTIAAWNAVVKWSRKGAPYVPQDEDGRLWDVVYMARRAMVGAEVVSFGVFCIPNWGGGRKAKYVALKAVWVDDEGWTIMLPHES